MNPGAAAVNSTGAEPTRPLSGIRVLTVENFLAGPFASMWLADAGAEVVKVEEPGGGDANRSTHPLKTGVDGVPRSLNFLRSNRNKKSITLDLKSPEGKVLFKSLIAEADIFVENLRPNVMDKLGLGWDVLKEVNPRLIYVAVSGFGHHNVLPSPFTDRPAFDIVGQALSGLMNRAERKDDEPVYLGFSLADIQGGILGAYGASLALVQRQLTGRGQMVDISLYDSCLALNNIAVAMYSAFRTPGEPGLQVIAAPFGTYRVSDGYVVVAALGDLIWERFCDAIGAVELQQDERFRSGKGRFENIAALNEKINPWFLARTRKEAVDTLLAHGVPTSNVNDMQDVFECPHVASRKMLLTLDDPAWGKIQVAGNPVKMSGAPEPETNLPPMLGEHTRDVLARWVGATDERIENLRAKGVI